MLQPTHEAIECADGTHYQSIADFDSVGMVDQQKIVLAAEPMNTFARAHGAGGA